MYQMSVSMDNQQNIAKLKDIPDCDILVLPEMWNCPYHNDALKTAYLRHDESLMALKKLAKSHRVWIVAGSICADKYNRCYILNSDGDIVCSYDKTHLFEFHNKQDYCENEVFVPGNHLQCFDTPWGKCGILLCYDIRFPEVSRILAQNGAQILFCPAAFNEQATKKHWKLFVQTRALENEVFLCGVAPAKYTYKNYTSGGHSMLVDGFGNIVVELDEEEACKVVDIHLKDIEKVRKRMPYWKVRRNDLYELKEMEEKMKTIQINEIEGFQIGSAQDTENATGCTVILCKEGATAGVDVRGGGPATRETDLLNPKNMVQKIHAVTLSGGSAFGLESSSGVMQYLSEHEIGFDMKNIYIPIVCEACLFDCGVGNSKAYPNKQMGYDACMEAEKNDPKQGNIGAGTGASVGKFFGPQYAMKAGLGFSALQIGPLKVGAIVVVNACGDIFYPNSDKPIAGIYDRNTNTRLFSEDEILKAAEKMINSCGMNTTIGCIITNADLNKAQMNKIASMAHNGYARCIRPVHTSSDGDTIFAMTSNKVPAEQDLVGIMAVKAMEQAIVNAGTLADSAYGLASYKEITKD